MGSALLPFLYQEVSTVRRVLATSVFILLAALTGCSGNEPAEEPHGETSPSVIDEGDSPMEQTEPCAKECSNQEVADSGCDQGKPRTVGKAVEVSPEDLNGVKGVFELRMADPSVCEGIYWARFRPYADTAGPWVVNIRTEGLPGEEQPSVPDDPAIDGYTEGVFAEPGSTVVYCLQSGKQGVCLKHEDEHASA